MKKIIITATLALASSLFSFSQEAEFKDLELVRQKQIENIKNSELWDMERMKNDIMPANEFHPIQFGAFPVPHYDQLGPYRGGGYAGNTKARSLPEYKLMIEDKEIVFDSYFIGDSPFYKEENRNRVFFTIVTVIDTVDVRNFALGSAMMLSRNHPDYGGEGSIVTKNNRIDYVTFTTPEKGSFAIVNMRLFHLEYGGIILVAPQKDGSLRSLQIKGEKITTEGVFDYIKNEVLKREDAIQFFTSEGVI